MNRQRPCWRRVARLTCPSRTAVSARPCLSAIRRWWCPVHDAPQRRIAGAM